MLLFLLACTKTPDLQQRQPSIPILPAPKSSWYSTEGDRPKDPLVAQVVGKMNWSESLSGAGTNIGLNIKDRDPRLDDAKWAAINAGFPYSVDQMIVGEVEADSYPQDLDRLLRQMKPMHLGLVRVRTGQKDRWIALFGGAGTLEEGFQKEARLGEEVNLKGLGTMRLSDPSGKIIESSLPYTFQPQERGEWWVELNNNGIYSSVPIYVETGAPVVNLFGTDEDLGLVNKAPLDVEEEALVLMDIMRERKGLILLESDKMLDSLAQYPLKYLVEGTWSAKTGVEHLQKAGFIGGPVYQLACKAENALTCLDQLSWNLDSRKALLDPQIRMIGIKAHVETSSVSLILNLSSL